MTERQKQLYELLLTDKNHWFTQEEICTVISDYHYTDDTRNHCVDIGMDRLEINNDDTIDEIIVTHRHKFKIADINDYVKARNSHIRRLKVQVAQLKAMDRKFERNGQGQFLSETLKELYPDIKFHDTFNKGE